MGNSEVFETIDVRALPLAGGPLASSHCSCTVSRKAFSDRAKVRICCKDTEPPSNSATPVICRCNGDGIIGCGKALGIHCNKHVGKGKKYLFEIYIISVISETTSEYFAE